MNSCVDSPDTFDSVGGMSCSVPSSIRQLCQALVGKNCVIVLKSGIKQLVNIDAVNGDLVICTMLGRCSCPNIKFIDIHCICEVITNCPTALKSIVR